MARQHGPRRSVGSLARAELRAKPGRAITLGTGILVAAVSFGLLSSETATSDVQVTATVKKNFRAAYDILVRPKDAETAFEKSHGVVDDGFLSGLFGGITMKQYDEIKSIPGVSLAAPISNVGYFLLDETVFVPFPKTVPKSGQALYKVTTNWNVHSGLSSYPARTLYVYWTSNRLTFSSTDPYDGTEHVPGEKQPLNVCEGFDRSKPVPPVRSGSIEGAPADPYAATLQIEEQLVCASPKVTVTGAARSEFASRVGPSGETIQSAEETNAIGAEPSGQLGAEIEVQIPVLVSGIDPTAENQLVGLKAAMTSGSYLTDGAGLTVPETNTDAPPGSPKVRKYPVIASTDTYLDQTADVSISELDVPARTSLPKVLASHNAYSFVTHLSGPVVGDTSLSPTTAWRKALADLTPNFVSQLSPAYWRPSGTADRVTKEGVITPSTVRNDPTVWTDNSNAGALLGGSFAPPGSNDTWYRSLEIFGQSGAHRTIDGEETNIAPVPELAGTFDPSKLRGFSPLSKVPLQTFYPPTVTAGNTAAKKALGSTPLGPTTNLAGYLAQPPLLLTTLQGAIALENGAKGESFNEVLPDGYGNQTKSYHFEAFQGASPKAPISTIQVRVKGVTGPNALSLAKIKLVAEQIEQKTGLTVDITAGSSPTSEKIQLASGKFGQPPLLVDQGWVKKGVDSGIIQALSNQDLALFLLVLVVCGLFVASATAASVRQRRREIAILGTLGWQARSIFSLVVGEAALVGLGAGVLGCGVAVGLAEAGSLDIPDLRLGLVVPIAVALAVVAAAIPAWRAARIPPLDALRDPVRPSARRHRIRSVTGLAFANVVRVPGRSLVALVTLILGVASLALIVGITVAFRGDVAGNLLGNVVAVNVRGVDLASAILIVVVGAASVADVLFVSLRERSAELATLRAVGWTERSIIGMAAREGLLLGVVGSLVGAGIGVAAVALLGGAAGDVLLAAALAVVAGCVVTTAALVFPLARLARLAPVAALAGE